MTSEDIKHQLIIITTGFFRLRPTRPIRLPFNWYPLPFIGTAAVVELFATGYNSSDRQVNLSLSKLSEHSFLFSQNMAQKRVERTAFKLMPARESNSQWQCSQLSDWRAIAMCESAPYASLAKLKPMLPPLLSFFCSCLFCFVWAKLKPMLPLFVCLFGTLDFFSERTLFFSFFFLLSLYGVILNTAEFCVVADNSFDCRNDTVVINDSDCNTRSGRWHD